MQISNHFVYFPSLICVFAQCEANFIVNFLANRVTSSLGDSVWVGEPPNFIENFVIYDKSG